MMRPWRFIAGHYLVVLRVQSKLGAIATVIGLQPVFAAARPVSVSRFSLDKMRRR